MSSPGLPSIYETQFWLVESPHRSPEPVQALQWIGRDGLFLIRSRCGSTYHVRPESLFRDRGAALSRAVRVLEREIAHRRHDLQALEARLDVLHEESRDSGAGARAS